MWMNILSSGIGCLIGLAIWTGIMAIVAGRAERAERRRMNEQLSTEQAALGDVFQRSKADTLAREAIKRAVKP